MPLDLYQFHIYLHNSLHHFLISYYNNTSVISIWNGPSKKDGWNVKIITDILRKHISLWIASRKCNFLSVKLPYHVNSAKVIVQRVLISNAIINIINILTFNFSTLIISAIFCIIAYRDFIWYIFFIARKVSIQTMQKLNATKVPTTILVYFSRYTIKT